MSQAGTHTPVLTRAVVDLLGVEPGDVVVDATVGLGGHARLLATAAGPDGVLLGLDVDADNLAQAAAHLTDAPGSVVLRRYNFAKLPEAVEEAGLGTVDVILADLGVSSSQLGRADRGFSFSVDGPLDMRMDDRLAASAADLVNRLSESDLADLIYQYGQERHSRRIARRICAVRREGRITRTARLSEAVCSALRVNPASRASRIHPATRTFQALRIAVNGELDALDGLLACAPSCLGTGGRIGVISFHSLEDGRVKRAFREGKRAGVYEILTKKPVVADLEERHANPRSRSAKLRVARRTDRGFAPDRQEEG
ncbi:MAG: 16S rRNA (cytosine(1402)-N(4))-methyltransferase RsmH [Phycisphaerae bacterium]